MAEYQLHTTEFASAGSELRAGDFVRLSGTLYTARDAAHKRIFEALDADESPPFPLKGSLIYYAGPTPGRAGMAVGSCGPTTSSRMDPFSPRLLDLGLSGMIGKGARSPEVIAAIVRNRTVYFSTIGGAGALIAKCVRSAEVIAYPDLLTESVKRLEVVDLPLFTAIDSRGTDLFKEGRKLYAFS